jgi:hypothetical protein
LHGQGAEIVREDVMQVAGQPGPFGQGRRLLPGGAGRCLLGEQGLSVLAAV